MAQGTFPPGTHSSPRSPKTLESHVQMDPNVPPRLVLAISSSLSSGGKFLPSEQGFGASDCALGCTELWGGPVDKWGETRDKKRSGMGQAPVFPVPSTYENSNLNFIFMPLAHKRDADYGQIYPGLDWVQGKETQIQQGREYCQVVLDTKANLGQT